MSDVVTIAPPFEKTTDKQNALAAAWYDPRCQIVVGSGALRSGKSQGAARLLLEAAIEQPSTYAICRQTYREIEDSLKPMLLRGDGSLPPLIPQEAIAEIRAGDNLVRLKNGSTLLFRSLDEPSKLLGLTLGGALLDQLEEVDGGPAGEHLWDTILGRLNDPGGPRKALVVLNPGALTHWAFRRLINPQTADKGVRVVHFSMLDNAQNLPSDYLERQLASKETRPHFYKTYVEGVWGAIEGAAFEEWNDEIHVVDPFVLRPHWLRFESLDHGAASPSAWLAWAVDEDGNCIIHDEWYAANMLVSQHAAEVIRRRAPREPGEVPSHGLNWWQGRNERGDWERHLCYADPSIGGSQGLSTSWGAPASVWTEYRQHGVDWIRLGNRDRAAGFSRLQELIHVDPERLFPSWHPRAGQRGSPRLFVFRGARNLIEQIKSAPIEDEGIETGRAIGRKFESAHGHSLASCRYGALSRPAPSPNPPETPGGEYFTRGELQQQVLERYTKRVENAPKRRSYRWV